MAQIMKRESHLKNEVKKSMTIAAILFPIFIITNILLIQLHNPMISIIAFFGLGIPSFSYLTRASTFYVGYKGEKNTLDLLAELPDDYYILNNVMVQVKGKESELDNIIVSPNGVMVLEVKNHNGSIHGDAEDKHWTQHKVGRKGTPYSKQMYSPIKQVGTHTWRLSQFLKANGFHVWVDNAVYFANPETDVIISNLSESKTPVFSYDTSDELLDYLQKEKRKKLSEENIQKIVELLNKLD